MNVLPKRSCLICCLPRSGSWVLAQGLRSTGLAGRPEEYFWDGLRPFYTRQWGLREDAPEPRYLSMALRAGTTSNGVFSAKIHWFQMRQLLRRLRGLPYSADFSARQLVERVIPVPRFVRLIRQDKVRQAISYHRAIKTGIWWKGRQPDRPITNGHVDFGDIASIEAMLTQHEANWARFFSDSGLTPLVVTYEELCANYASVMRKVVEHLGIEIPPGFRIGPPPLEKQGGLHTECTVQDYITLQRTMSLPVVEHYGTELRVVRAVSRRNHWAS
jgi:trehalose 2-sulfotransferase